MATGAQEADASRLEVLLVSLAVPPDEAARLRAEIEQRHAEPARHYHTLDHVHAVLGRVEAIVEDAAWQPRCPAALELAVWWHDAVYDPGAAGNEAASGWLLRDRLRPFLEPLVLERAVRLVHATDGHRADDSSPDWPDVAVLLDADLGVLAGTPEEYHAYVAAVREEFSFLGDDDWRRGRAEVLRDLVARPLFRTPLLRAREPQARANVARELESLAPPR